MKTLFGLFLLLFFAIDLDAYAQPHKQRRNRNKTSVVKAPVQTPEPTAALEAIESGKTASFYYSSHAIGAPQKRDRTRNLRQAGPASRQHDPHVREKLIYLHQRGRDRGPIRSYYSPKNQATSRKLR